MLAAQHLFDQDVKVEIVDCYDQSDDQIRQIDSLVASGIDLLVVAPNDYKIAPALKRAKDKGIPIVLFDRMVESNDYTAFIGGSNVAIGEMAANYAVQLAVRTLHATPPTPLLRIMTTVSATPRCSGMPIPSNGLCRWPKVGARA